ncbi:MAG: site-specific integrase [Acidobacteriales bacterium]|nr:site-specific integrase [Terriglobales bacterium]
MRERYQKPEVKDLGTKWKMVYWDYSSNPRRKRSKVWGKNIALRKRDAQRLADQFMEKVNARNNEPGLYPSDDETLASLIAKCREKTWPHLKNSTRQHYEFLTDKYLLPVWGTMKLRKMSIIELQDFFNSFYPRLAPKSIRLMHACLRVHLNQAKVWGMIEKNPAIGVKLPRRKQRKPTILLPVATIGKLVGFLPEPTKSVVVLIVFGSLRIGEVLALRWRHIQADRITIEERVYEGEFDDVKTDAGEREVPFDKRGLMKSALIGRWNASKHRQPDDLVFSTRKGGPLGRRNLLRHIKTAATKLGLSKAVDFRSFRTMHSSLMLREGARPEVVRDNMGHANIDVTQNVYGKSWWEERVEAVTRAVDAVSAAAQNAEKETKQDQPETLSNEWVPLWVPQQEARIASC